MNKLSGTSLIVVAIIFTAAVLVLNLAFWYNQQIFQSSNFKETLVESVLRQDSREAIASELVDKTLSNRPVIKKVAGPTLESIVVGILGSPVARPIFDKLALSVHQRLISPTTKTVVVDTSLVNDFFIPIIAKIDPQAAEKLEQKDLPENIVLVKQEGIPTFYGLGRLSLWLIPLSFFTGLALLAWLAFGSVKYSSTLKVVGTSLAVGSLSLMILPKLLEPALLSQIASSNTKLVIDNIYTAFLATLINQTSVIFFAGLLLVAAGFLFPILLKLGQNIRDKRLSKLLN